MCRQLGFPGAVAAVVDSAFRAVDALPVAADSVVCPPETNNILVSLMIFHNVSTYKWECLVVIHFAELLVLTLE